jgi:taurine--2-oxoglutarate transaminase
MTIAKGVTSGYLPLGGVVVSDPIAEYFADKMLYMGLTYSGHPMSMAAGVATIDVYQQDGLIENTKTLGQELAAELRRLQDRHTGIGDARSIGLFSVLEMVKDRQTKEPVEDVVMNTVRRKLLEEGLFTFINHHLVFICPPLCITHEELLTGLKIIDRVLADCEL